MTQEQRRSQTETALLAAAAELVVESGLRSVTLANVGARAGYSRGIVTHSFGSKAALIEALARRSQAGFVRGLDRFRPGLERFLHHLDGYLGTIKSTDVRYRAFLLLWSESITDPELRETFQERDEQFRAELRAELETAVGQGEVRPELDLDAASAAAVGQVRGVAMQHLLAPTTVDLDRVRPVVVEQWRAFLKAAQEGFA